MKLLFDQNLSFRLIAALEDLYPGSAHVRLLGMEAVDDEVIWEYAKKNGFVIVTQDSDFNERGLIHGYPPKVIWIRCGNTATHYIQDILRRHHSGLTEFQSDRDSACIELF